MARKEYKKETKENELKTETSVNSIQPVEILPASNPVKSPGGAPSEISLSDCSVPPSEAPIIPRLTLVQNVGQLCEQFAPGSFVLDSRLALTDPGSADPAQKILRAILIGLWPIQYVEHISSGSGPSAWGAARRYSSVEEVISNNGTLYYREYAASLHSAKPLAWFRPIRTGLVLIARPAHLGTTSGNTLEADFPLGVEGEGAWALATWTLRGVSYAHVLNRIIYPQKSWGLLKNGYPTRILTIQANKKAYKISGGQTNAVWVPVVNFERPTPPALIELAAQVLAGLIGREVSQPLDDAIGADDLTYE